MPRTLIVGFGRAGHGLHWSVLKRLRRDEAGAALLSPLPPVVHDFDPTTPQLADHEVIAAPSLVAARDLLDPADTVVHLCTPPTHRLQPLRELAELGFRSILVEKPLLARAEDLPAVEELRRAYGLRLTVVAHWLRSALTQRLARLVAEGELGELRTVYVAQRKPRLGRTLSRQGHPTAFDVELPHSVGVTLRLAGDAEVAGAELGDMRAGDTVVPEMGTARLLLDHLSGVQTEIFSDLASPVRERVIKLGFGKGWAVGHYPVSESDDYAHLDTSLGSGGSAEVFRDDSLGRFLLHAYGEFTSGADLEPDFALNTRVTTVLAEAKQLARATRAAVPADRAPGAQAQLAADVQEVLPHAS